MSDKVTVEDVRRMEELITDFLPMDVKSEISVFNWLKEMSLKPVLA